jgi:hypothetical protein
MLQTSLGLENTLSNIFRVYDEKTKVIAKNLSILTATNIHELKSNAK